MEVGLVWFVTGITEGRLRENCYLISYLVGGFRSEKTVSEAMKNGQNMSIFHLNHNLTHSP